MIPLSDDRAEDSFKYFPPVRTSKIQFEDFDPNRIKKSLLRETDLSEEEAERVTLSVIEKIRRMGLFFLSGPLIRELVCTTLLEFGYEDARAKYTRLGLPSFDVEALIKFGDKENANLQHNPETIHKLAADAVFDQYALLRVLPLDLADAHISGKIHIHDLEYFATRPFCQEHDLRFFFRKGLVVDGQGIHTSVAGPAKHAEVAILHAAKALAAAQTNWAGGQGYDFFNVWLAPFLRGLPYNRVKQLAQMFVYEMSQMYVARGGQTVFSSISLEPSVPKIAQSIPAVLPGGKVNGSTYGDFEAETNTFFNAIVDVYMEGDYQGKPFNFPKPEFKLRREFIDKFEEEYEKVARLTAKFGSPYFLNMCPDYMPDIANSQCCRIILAPDSDELEDFYAGRIRMGSLQMVTINLPRVAYDVNSGSDEELFEVLDERVELARRVLLIKRELIKRRVEEGVLPFASMDCDGEPYLNVDKQMLSIGFVGLNEMLKYHTDYWLHEDREAWKLGLKVVKYLADRADELTRETGYRFQCIQTPAESCAHRLALIDFKAHGDRAVVQGDKRSGSIYYTNSSHVQPSADLPLSERIRIESSFHPLTRGGAIMHVWLGEANPDPIALWKLTKRIATQSLASYFAYTKDLTICSACSKVSYGLLSSCPFCGAGEEKIEWWSRITGYYQRVKSWNKGKKMELIERRRYQLSTA